MIEYDNVKDCLKDLYSLINDSVTNVDGTSISKNDFRDLITERLYNLMDVLGNSGYLLKVGV